VVIAPAFDGESKSAELVGLPAYAVPEAAISASSDGNRSSNDISPMTGGDEAMGGAAEVGREADSGSFVDGGTKESPKPPPKPDTDDTGGFSAAPEGLRSTVKPVPSNESENPLVGASGRSLPKDDGGRKASPNPSLCGASRGLLEGLICVSGLAPPVTWIRGAGTVLASSRDASKSGLAFADGGRGCKSTAAT
jgi:hypothetical protein